jgi:predicted acetyltransferase
MRVTPRIVSETSITSEEDAAIRDALCLCFPPDREIFSRTRAWHGTYPTWSVVVDHQRRVVAHAGVVEREILIGAERVRAAGIQNVLVLPEHRKSNLFRQIMSVVMEEARRRELDLGILFCTPDLGRLYAWLGWRLVKGRSVIRIDDEGLAQPLPEKNATMFYPLRLPDIPCGDIHLLGNDW